MRFLAVFALSALTLTGCGGGAPSTPAAKPAAKVQNAKPEGDLANITLTEESEKHLALTIADATLQPVRNVRTVGGEVVVPTGQTMTVSAPFAGTLALPAGRAAATGAVAKGAVLFELLPLQSTDRDARTTADRTLTDAQARLTEATQRLTRLETLLAEGSVSLKAVEEARAAHAVAKAAVEAAQAQRSSIQRLPVGARGELALTAPVAGQVIALHAAAGQTVAAGAPIAEIANLTVTWLKVSVYAGDIPALDLTQPVAVAALGNEQAGPWIPAQRITGPPSANAAASSVDVYFQLPQSGHRPGERMAVRLPLKALAGERAIVIPASAVVYDLTGGTWVYESKGAHVFQRRRVELAGLAGADLIVRRGLTAGVRIVTVGAAELYGTEFYVSK